MKSIKVTVFNATKSRKLAIGQKLELIHDPNFKEVQFDEKAIMVFEEGTTNKVGVVGSKVGATVISGTVNNEVLFDEMVSHKLEAVGGSLVAQGVVVGDGLVSFRDGSHHTAYIVEVKLPEAPVAPKTQEFELQVRGSVKDYKGKTTVLKELTDGKAMQLWIEKDGDKVITFFTNSNGEKIKAGVVSKVEKGEEEKLMTYLEALYKKSAAQLVEPFNALGNAYSVKFEIDQQTFKDVLSGKTVKTLDEVRKEVVANGIVDGVTLVEIEKYLKSNKVSPKQIKRVFESMRTYADDIQNRIPNPTVKYKDTVGLVKKSIVYLNTGKHLRFVGEKGVGKNVLIETLAWVYQRPLYEMALNSQTDKMDILGSKTFESTVDEDGKEKTVMSFDKEVLVEAMEVGGFMNLDEINTADPSVLVVLHPIADGRGRLEVPGYGLVEADENFSLILSMNQDYIGTSPLNEATRDRFIPILFPENPSIAKMLAVRVPDANPVDIDLADRVYGSIMKLVKDGQLTNDCVTNRGFIDSLEVAEDLGLQEALLDNIANRIEDEEYRTTVASLIDDIVG